MIWVVDASVAIEFLLRTPSGQSVESLLVNDEVFAPALIDAEVLAVFRRLCVAGRLQATRAEQALEDLSAWQLQRVALPPLLPAAWQLRHNVSGYDAFYVATAMVRGATLLTTDAPLGRAAGLVVPVQTVQVPTP